MPDSSLAPICLFVYARPAQTRATIEALARNPLAASSDLFVFSDGPKPGKESLVAQVRKLLESIDGFRSITIEHGPANRGLANSIIAGVTQVIDRYGKAIVLEDDILTSPNFLAFMNGALDYYADASKVFAISGFAYPMRSLRQRTFDNAFGYRSYSWGWATWKDRWALVDWNAPQYEAFASDPKNRKLFNRGGSDLWAMLKKQMEGRIDSWMIRWVFTQHRLGLLDVFPTVSKTANIGFGEGATHTACSDRRYKTVLDEGSRSTFNFDPDVSIDKRIQAEWEWKHSYLRRFWYKAMNWFPFR